MPKPDALELRGARHRIVAAVVGDGRSPATEYIRGLPNDRQDALLVRMRHYADTGTLKVPQQLNHLGDGLMEFKLSEGPRVIFYHAGRRDRGLVILTHGFTKKSQKTPAVEIQRAKEIRSEVEHGLV